MPLDPVVLKQSAACVHLAARLTHGNFAHVQLTNMQIQQSLTWTRHMAHLTFVPLGQCGRDEIIMIGYLGNLR
jgi:hypothetical protein